MESIVGSDNAPSDAELISRVRDGDRTAFGELYGRHSRAAGALARQISVSGAEADDLVAESFARVLDTMLDGRGPDSAFRAYLFTTLRHTAYDRTRKDKRLQFTDDITAHEVAVDVDDPVLLQMENSFVAKAFGQLPERWRTILWHTQVEGQSPAEVGLILGMSPNAVTSLAFRAREGLREAYLQVHMAETVAERCRATIDRLGAYTRGGLSKRETAQVQAHLAECDRCPALAAELSEINSGLRGLLAPLLLGSAAAGYIATLPAVPVLTQVGASVTGAGVGSTLLKFGAAAKISTAVLTPAVVTGGVMAAAVATVTAVVVGLATPGGGNQTADPLNTQFPSASTGATAGTTDSGTDPFAGIPGITVTPPTVDSQGEPVEAPRNTASIPPPVDPSVLAEEYGLPGPGSYPGTGSPAVPTLPTDGSSPSSVPLPPLTPGAGTGGPTDAEDEPSAPGTPAVTAPGTTPVVTPPVTTPPVSTPPASTPPATSPGTTPAPPPVTTPPAPTPPAPTPAAVNVNLTTGISGLTAGRTQTVTLTVTNAGGSTQPAGTATLTAGQGVNLVAAGVSTPALRTGSVAFARAAAAPGDVICDGSSCPLPELAPGATVELTLQVQVDPTATATDVSLTVYEAPVLDLTDVEVASGFATVQIVPTGPVAAGTNSQFVLTATPAEGVTNPGPVTVPTALTPTLYVSAAPEGCVLLPSGTDWECAPDETGQVGPLTLDTVATPSAEGDQQVAVSDAGGRELQAETPITVLPLDSSASVTMTGPFGGTSVAAPMIFCDLPRLGAIGVCGQKGYSLVPVEPASARELVTGGRTVVWAELTWAAAGSTGDDTVALHVDDTTTEVTGTALPVVTPDGDRMNAHHADVTSLITGDSTIFVDGLAAALTDVENTTPFAAWSLSVIWADPTMATSTVTYTNASTRLLPTKNRPLRAPLGDVTSPLTDLYVTLWATDPWGTKSLTLGGTALPTAIDGTLERDGEKYTVGYDLLAFGAGQLGDATGTLVFGNALDSVHRDDGVWIGPVLAIGPAATPGG
ncbi:sigma-70 family RNA polymerase sigma factor [Nakamurella deserti]|uniref:sigma-70 family RNA polymerase sigma factor n=1 Tax=Nakamurella deserti TaxID=2164074 RepID=UPI000DBE2381|nr:sigma-70 family RNA polymerase sigma factor [Nakamurella deserti]